METCPDPSLLDAFALGNLAPSPRGAVEAHLDRCSTCSREFTELMRIYGGHSVESGEEILALAKTALAAPSSFPPPNRDGTIGRYRLLHQLGEGGMGVVFAAHDPSLDRTVALKILHADPSIDPEERKLRLAREAQAMAKLSHPNVVTVHDVGIDTPSGQLFVAMELVTGATLSTWIRSERPNERAVLDAFLQAGRGLSAAHAAGLVHRDFKPDNVLVGKDGRVRVSDFGLARTGSIVPHDGAPTDAVTLLTRHGAIVGTPAYMAPEQFRGEPADARTDQFAFAIALFEARFGVRPFLGSTITELSRNVLAGALHGVRDKNPRWLRAFFLRALSVDRANRFASMDEALSVLASDRTRVRRWLTMIAAVLAASAALVGVFYAVATRDGDAPNARGALFSAETSALDPPPTEAAEKEAARIRDERETLDDELTKALGFQCAPLKTKAEALVARARSLAYDPVTAETLVTLAHVEKKLERPKRAETALDEAVRLARASRHDEVLLDATTELVEVVGIDLGLVKEADTWIGFATAEAKRRASDRKRGARLDLAIGRVRQRAGRLEEARAHLDTALALREEDAGAESLEVAETLRERAYVRAAAGDAAGALDDALRAQKNASADSIVGLGIGMEVYTLALGEMLLGSGRLDEAIASLERTEALVVEKHSPPSVSLRAWDALARAFAKRGELARSREVATKAEAGFLSESIDGKLAFHDPTGDKPRSAFAIDFSARVKAKVEKHDDTSTVGEGNLLACAIAVEGDEGRALSKLDETLSNALENPVIVVGAIGAIKFNRALLLFRKGDLEGASTSIVESREALAREVGTDHVRYGIASLLRARILSRLGSPSAEPEALAAAKIIAARRGNDDPLILSAKRP